MKHVLDVDKVDAIDFLSGDDAYKKNWMTHSRERIKIDVFNSNTLKGRLLSSRRLLGSAVRSFSG